MFDTIFSESVFIRNILFYSTCMKNVFMIIWKSDYNNSLYNILYEYKNTFNNNKLLKIICITKKNIINQ